MPSYNKKRILTAAQKNLQYYQDTFFSFIPLSDVYKRQVHNPSPGQASLHSPLPSGATALFLLFPARANHPCSTNQAPPRLSLLSAGRLFPGQRPVQITIISKYKNKTRRPAPLVQIFPEWLLTGDTDKKHGGCPCPACVRPAVPAQPCPARIPIRGVISTPVLRLRLLQP